MINSITFNYCILIITLGTVIGMNIHRNLLLKFFLCFESFLFIISVIISIWSHSINGIIILLYLLWNPTFEIILGLTILFFLNVIHWDIINSPYFRYYDLKKTIALSPILHLNLVFYSLLSSNSSGLYRAIVIPLPHSLPPIGPSLFMGLLINKTNTRLLDASFSVSSILRLLLLFFLLANNSFPSPINYIGEIFALLAIISIDVLFTLVFLLVSSLSTLFRFIVLNRKLPYYSSYYFYFIIYYYLLLYLLLYIYLLGIYLLLTMLY